MPPPSSERVVSAFGSAALSQLQALVARASGRGGAGDRQPPPARPAADRGLAAQFAEHAKRIERVLGGAAAWAAATAGGLAARGFRGSVEGARLDYAMDQLGRQMAAVFQPVVQALTYGATRFGNALANLDGTGQNRVLGGVAGTLGGFALGGPGGALVGGLAGARAGGGDWDDAARIAGAGAAWWRAGAAGATGLGRLGGAAKLFGKVAPGLEFGAEVLDATGVTGRDSFYDMERRRGTSRLGSGLAAGGHSLLNLVTFGYHADRLRERGELDPGKAAAPPPPKRDPPTPFQSETNAAGGTYFKLQEAVLRTTAGPRADDAGPLKPVVDALEVIIKLLGKMAGVDVSFERPAAAEDTRVK